MLLCARAKPGVGVGDTFNKIVSFSSRLYALSFLVYSIRKPEMQLEKGMLIISIEVDVGSRELVVIFECQQVYQ